jgi:FkbM family methyltransferase
MYRLARQTLRKVMQKVGRRWPDQALLDELEMLRSRVDGLRVVRNGAEQDGEFTCLLPTTLEERRLYQSRFNMAWIDELRLSPKVVLDVGAYDGGDSIRFKYRFPDARVIAFEADPERYAVVAGNVEPFGIACVNAAVCDRDGPVPWYKAYDGHAEGRTGAQGSMYRHSPQYERRYDFVRQSPTPTAVDGLRIDTFCRKSAIDDIDVLHIDAEGAEYEVIAGLGALLPKMIYVEAVPFDAWVGARQSRELHVRVSCMGYLLAAELINDRLYVRADLARSLL